MTMKRFGVTLAFISLILMVAVTGFAAANDKIENPNLNGGTYRVTAAVGTAWSATFTFASSGTWTYNGQQIAAGVKSVTISGSVTSTAQNNKLEVKAGSDYDFIWIKVSVPDSPADTTAPTISGAANASAEATGPNGAVVTYDVTATDNVDGSVAVTCTPPSGSTFPLGTTTVTCTAADSAGNTSTASFTVTVSDTTPPVISSVGDATAEATGPDGAAVSWSVSASDTVDTDVTVDCSPAPGSTFGLGTTTVTCTATDDSGNSASTSFTVTVVDTTPPVLNLPSGGTYFGSYTGGSATATDLVDSDVTVSCTPISVGANTVTCTATDDSGNSSRGSYQVTLMTGSGSYAGQNRHNYGSTVPFRYTLQGVDPGTMAGTLYLNGVASGTFRWDASAGQYVTQWRSPYVVATYTAEVGWDGVSGRMSLGTISMVEPAVRAGRK